MILLQILWLSLSFAQVDLSTTTSLDGHRQLVAQCAEGDVTCQAVCADNTCNISLPPCLDCMSRNNNYVQVFLLTLGSYFTAGAELNTENFVQYLQSPSLMVWDSKSIYNTSEYDGIFIRLRFESLCSLDTVTRSPIVLDQLDSNNKFSYKSQKLAICFYEQLGTKAYSLDYKEAK